MLGCFLLHRRIVTLFSDDYIFRPLLSIIRFSVVLNKEKFMISRVSFWSWSFPAFIFHFVTVMYVDSYVNPYFEFNYKWFRNKCCNLFVMDSKNQRTVISHCTKPNTIVSFLLLIYQDKKHATLQLFPFQYFDMVKWNGCVGEWRKMKVYNQLILNCYYDKLGWVIKMKKK